MCMTKKDFKAIAAILADVRERQESPVAVQAVDAIIEQLDEFFEQNYLRYDSHKFLTKAGYFSEQ